MVEIAKLLLEFILVFLIVLVIYWLFNLKNFKKYDRKKMPMGIKYLVYKYNLDVVRIGYKRILKNLIVCDSLIVAILFIATKFIDNIYIRLLVAFVLVFPLFAGVYHLIAQYYKKENE